MKKLHFAVLVAIVVILGAAILGTNTCPIGPEKQTWELDLWVQGETTLPNGTTHLEMQIILSGHVTGTVIEDVRLQYLDADGETIRTGNVGTLSGYTRENVTANLDRRPDKILVETGEIKTGEETEYWIAGQKRTESGQFQEFTHRHREC